MKRIKTMISSAYKIEGTEADYVYCATQYLDMLDPEGKITTKANIVHYIAHLLVYINGKTVDTQTREWNMYTLKGLPLGKQGTYFPVNARYDPRFRLLNMFSTLYDTQEYMTEVYLNYAKLISLSIARPETFVKGHANPMVGNLVRAGYIPVGMFPADMTQLDAILRSKLDLRKIPYIETPTTSPVYGMVQGQPRDIWVHRLDLAKAMCTRLGTASMAPEQFTLASAIKEVLCPEKD